jgi:hypothetical protein
MKEAVSPRPRIGDVRPVDFPSQGSRITIEPGEHTGMSEDELAETLGEFHYEMVGKTS